MEGEDCGLHPLIHTLLKFDLVQDVERFQGGFWGLLEGGDGLTVRKSIGLVLAQVQTHSLGI